MTINQRAKDFANEVYKEESKQKSIEWHVTRCAHKAGALEEREQWKAKLEELIIRLEYIAEEKGGVLKAEDIVADLESLLEAKKIND